LGLRRASGMTVAAMQAATADQPAASGEIHPRPGRLPVLMR
jgi:hypothetical protein